MAPAKAPIARAAAGHTKTSSLSSRSVVPAIPLAMMPKKISKATNAANSNGAAATNATAARSLDAALLGHGSGNSPERLSATSSVPETRMNGSKGVDVSHQAPDPLAVQMPSSNGVHTGNQANGTNTGTITAKSEISDTQLSNHASVPRADSASADKPMSNGELVISNPSQTRGKDRAPTPTQPRHDHVADDAIAYADHPHGAHSQATLPLGGPGPSFPITYSSSEAEAPATVAVPKIDRNPPHFHPTHQTRLSNGAEIMFGGFPDSHTPSPAPMPLGVAGFVPPPHPPINGSRLPPHHGHNHSQSNSVHNGHSVAVRADGGPALTTLDGYGQPNAPMQARGENFNPNPARYGPPTPLSYHGSHNSVDTINNVEVSGAFVPAPGIPHAATNQALGFHPPGPPFPAFIPPNMYNDRSLVAEDQLMGSIDYFRAQFGNTELSDSTIELVYSDGRRPSVKLPGHRIVLCRSPVLKQQIMMALRQSQSSVVTLLSDDKFVRSDAWWMALQRLYLHPLLNLPPLTGNANSAEFAGDHGDRFEFCLGYAASGHLLKLHDVFLRGLHMAADLINWNTVEVALDFVLQNTRQRHTDYSSEQDGAQQAFVEMEYGYGPDTRVLLDAIIAFLIAAFPPQFTLDTNVSDSIPYARIPQIASLSMLNSTVDHSSPAIARGSNAQHRSTPSRLGNIKFGDLPATDAHDTQSSHAPPSPYSSTLSRILLNLPFDELRAVLSYGQSSNASWKSAQSRMRAIPSVIAGREARRLRALQAVRHGALPDARAVQERLSANRRYAIVEPWDVLNWVELATFNENNEPVGLARNWQPAFSIGNRLSQPHAPEIAQSMV